MNNKIEKINDLVKKYDQYKNLLTDKQKEIFEQYYFKDLSMGEIAKKQNITKPAVSDLLKRTEKVLNNYAQKLEK